MASLIEIDYKTGHFEVQTEEIQKTFQEWSNVSSFNDYEKWDVVLNPFGSLEDKYKFKLVDESGNVLAIVCQDREYNCDTNIAEFDCIIPNPAISTEKILRALYEISKKEGWHAIQFSNVNTSNIIREDTTRFRTVSDLECVFREYGLQKLTKNHILKLPRQSTVRLSDSDSELDLPDSLHIEYDKWVWPIQSFNLTNIKTKSPWDTHISISIYGGSSETHTTRASIVKYTRDHSFLVSINAYSFTDKKTKFMGILFETPLVLQVKPGDNGDRYFDMTINGGKYGPNCCSNILSEFWKCDKCFSYRRFNKLTLISEERLGTKIVYGIEIPSHLLPREGNDFGYFTDISKKYKGYLHAVHYNFASFIHRIGIPCHSLVLTTSDGVPTLCFTKFPEISPPTQILEKKKTPKSTIPKVVRSQVWDKWIGADIGRTKCYVCRMNIIDKGGNFHCGHVIAESNGGELKVENLRPICGSCNSSMGTQDMREFCKRHYRDEFDKLY